MMRISGFATGMDIEQIVSDLMRVERLPVDKLQQNRQLVQWKMESYREINRKLDTFRNNIFDTVMRQANMLAKRVTSSNESLVTATAASTAGNMTLRISKVEQLATAASYNSTSAIEAKDGGKVDASASLRSQFAEQTDGWKWETGVVHSKNISVSSKSNIVDLDIENLKEENISDNMVVKINGKTYQVITEKVEDEEGNLIVPEGKVLFDNGKLEFSNDLREGTTVQVKYVTDKETETFTIPEGEEGLKTFQVKHGGLDLSSLKITAGSNTFSLNDGNIVTSRDKLEEGKVYVNLETGQIEFHERKLNMNVTVEYAQQYTTSNIKAYDESGSEVYDNFIFTSNQSLNQVLTELNRSSVKVNSFYDEFQGIVNVTRTETGIFNPKSNPDEEIFEPEIMFDGFFKNVLNLDGEQASVQAQNAKFVVNGLETERRSNTFTISGMTVTLKGKVDEEVTLASSIDTDTVFDTIKKFVDEYNELLEFVNGKLTEERYRDYLPLTDEQKDAMSEKDIERWEERARSGLLRNDHTLRSPFDRMRLDMYNPVSGELSTEFRQLAAIGITTSRDYMDRGKLEIDEEKLRAAIEQDPEGIYQLFAADGPTHAEKGIARRVRDTLDNAITAIAERAGGFRGKIANHQFTLGRELNSIEDRITNFERRLKQIEDRYWRQFNAMEAAVNRANQQAEMLFAQLYGTGQ